MKQHSTWTLAIAVLTSTLAAAAGCAAADPEGPDPTPSGGSGVGGGGEGGDGTIPEVPDCGDQCPCTAGEEESCYSGPEGTSSLGTCAAGTRVCQLQGEFGAWGPCTGEILPAAEACDDGDDNDCDGQTDEGCGCTPSAEVCDGVDNDCDGQTDEDLIVGCAGGCDTQACVGGILTGCGATGAILYESFEAVGAPQEGVVAPGTLGAFIVTAGDVDALVAPSGMSTTSHSGDVAIDLNGWGAGTLATAVPTTPGTVYALSFAYTKNPSPEVTWAIGASVKIDGVSLLDLTPNWPNDYTSLQWSCAALTFTATNSTTLIEIQSVNDNNGGVYLDTFIVKPQ
jgi:hypothetical protein